MDISIRVKNLTKVFPPNIRANDNLTFQVFKGEVFGVLGPNGAGKTTLIRQLTGQLRPTSGYINVLGIDVVKDPQAVKPFISVCPQETAIVEHLTVFEHLYYFARLKGLRKQDALREVKEVMELFRLKEYGNRLVSGLSGGLKRRLIVAQAFIGDADIIFLDEPTTGLDPASRRDVWSVIQRFRSEGKTIVLTTHYLEEAEKLCSRVMFLNKGKMVSIGTPDEVRHRLGSYIKIRFPRVVDPQSLGLESVGVITRVGDWIELIVPKSDRELVKNIVSKILDVTEDVEISIPSLEDVFLEVVEHGKV